MKELYETGLRVGALLSIVVAILGLGRALSLDIESYLALLTLMAVVIVGGTQIQLLRSISREVVHDNG